MVSNHFLSCTTLSQPVYSSILVWPCVGDIDFYMSKFDILTFFHFWPNVFFMFFDMYMSCTIKYFCIVCVFVEFELSSKSRKKWKKWKTVEKKVKNRKFPTVGKKTSTSENIDRRRNIEYKIFFFYLRGVWFIRGPFSSLTLRVSMGMMLGLLGCVRGAREGRGS